MKPFKASPAFTLCYDFLRWLIPVTQAFPRAQRFGLAKVLNDHALALQQSLFAAVQTPHTAAQLAQADVHLAMVRTSLRLSYDLNLLQEGSYLHGQHLLHGLGKVLGSWRRTLATTPISGYNSDPSAEGR